MVTLKGHTDIVMGMMVMSSLDNLVSASLDTAIRVWDTYTQKPVHTLLGHNKVRYTREDLKSVSCFGGVLFKTVFVRLTINGFNHVTPT